MRHNGRGIGRGGTPASPGDRWQSSYGIEQSTWTTVPFPWWPGLGP